MSYYVANEDFELECYDSSKVKVDLSGLSSLCYTIQKSSTNKSKSKAIIHNITINVTTVTGSIKTSKIDGSAVTFVSASGSINGSSEKYKSNKLSVCLADDTITPLNIASYTGKGSKGKLTVVGTNSSSGATVTDICDIWIKKAGQNVLKGV